MRTSIIVFTVSLISASVQAAPTVLECTVRGSKSNSKPTVETVSDTVEVTIDEDTPGLRIMLMNGIPATFTVLSGPMPIPSFKVVAQDRSTKDVWDMESRHTGNYAGTKYISDNAMRINRRTGAISASNRIEFETGFWTKFEATGNCIALKEKLKF